MTIGVPSPASARDAGFIRPLETERFRNSFLIGGITASVNR
ncbi:MAG: hypothetical protein RR063_07465 [Anaerovoracaceae bacterium]